jgi:hypothetical protein
LAGDQPLPQPGVDEQARGEVADEGDDHRRHGAPPDDADGRGQPEREQRVGEHDGALGVEDVVADAAVQVHERLRHHVISATMMAEVSSAVPIARPSLPASQCRRVMLRVQSRR